MLEVALYTRRGAAHACSPVQGRSRETWAFSIVPEPNLFKPQTCKKDMDHPPALAWADGGHDLTLQFKVHLGVWTDWSRGRVLGSTLTLTRTQANLLIAFTASFVVFVGSRFWRIACLVLHQSYSSAQPRDALHHQRQAVLRNSGSSDSGIVSGNFSACTCVTGM